MLAESEKPNHSYIPHYIVGWSLWKTVWQFLQKIHTKLSYGSALKLMSTQIPVPECYNRFIYYSPKCKQPVYLSAGIWLNKLV